MNLIFKLTPLFILISIVGAATGGYFYYQYQKVSDELKLVRAEPREDEVLIEEVSRLIALPSGEEPAITTVDGKKVLIYPKAKKAIYYDAEGKKIIDVASVNIGTASAAQSVRIVLRNGTSTTGLTTKAEGDVKKSITNATIVTKENASNDDYDKTIVIALTDSAKDAAAKLAKDLNVTTGELPSGESKPSNADLLVILGKDRI